ncbi:hypothetical protein BFP97_13630 [Roseivirga sp. 4D4]|uniref:CapA family protein n=1 Tax=Roseivirga sp. 4D4 TaxID=1889784 RepID=UPI0008533844|nr:CapA family protein [Roseivirga sp. 4D4]OEK02498.1 hypothetical protein BFP97_13630 [Roseivirga sp. 4D4]
MDKLSFLGDVYVPEFFESEVSLEHFIFNLEAPVTTDLTNPAIHKINLHIERFENIHDTFKRNPLAVCLSNNHIFDYGDSGFNRTTDILDKAQIEYFGAGLNGSHFNNPFVFTFSNSKKIGVLGFCCKSTHPSKGKNATVATIEFERIANAIEELKSSVDFVVLNLHWGDEEIAIPKPLDVIMARKLVDCGANLILGHHAHVIQSYEKYKGVRIYYGIGNCIFPDFDVQSKFDGDRFTTRSRKVQARRNKRSIMVHLYEDFSVHHEFLKFESGVLAYDKSLKLRFQFLTMSTRVYNTFKFFESRKAKIIGVLQNPRKLSFGSMLNFLKGK